MSNLAEQDAFELSLEEVTDVLLIKVSIKLSIFDECYTKSRRSCDFSLKKKRLSNLCIGLWSRSLLATAHSSVCVCVVTKGVGLAESCQR